jgi:hypothetical protein
LYCDLTRRQKYLYDEYINTDRTQATLKQKDYLSIMNILMQLRKVCNHPDLFETRDYVTPSKQLFTIYMIVPHIILTIFKYDPLKSINYKSLFLLIEEFEKFSKLDYMEIANLFPSKPFSEIYQSIVNKERALYTNKYLLDENDIMFKRQYADSTILYESNTDQIETYFLNLASNSNNLNLQNGNSNRNLNQSNNITNFSYAKNLYFPKYMCPTNIPLLSNTSLTNYFDIMHVIDTINLKDHQSYLKSAFEGNIEKLKTVKLSIKKRILHTYDIISRKGILYSNPIYGQDLVNKLAKFIFAIETVHSLPGNKNILYGNNYKNYENNLITCNSSVNKGMKRVLGSGLFSEQRRSLGYINNKNYEGIDPETIEKEEKDHLMDVENKDEETQNKENQIEIENTEIKEEAKEDGKEEIEKKEDMADGIEKDVEIRIEEPIIIQPPEIPKRKVLHINDVKEDFIDIPTFTPKDTIHFLNTDTISHLMYTPQKVLSLFDDLMSNFRIHIPNMISSGPQLISSAFKTDHYQTQNKYRVLYNNLNRIPSVQKYFSMFKIISFPDKNLVEYDSGKLIKLAQLLKKLKQNKSKALIFTQMTRMLDILEIFLNLHGYTYVRLDGSTKVEVRQQVVDKFNSDPKVFCFISSTRSGGIGLNLTAADSIVFIDTDWNPAMDKQAQDRCHRIGQTRTVNIYRLITKHTIEDNIFKKSIQKREISKILVEEGNFIMQNIKKLNIKSIFEEEKDDEVENSKMVVDLEKEPTAEKKNIFEFENVVFEKDEDQKNLEQMLIKIEDDEDVQALKNVSKEMLGEYEKENEEQKFLHNEEVY